MAKALPRADGEPIEYFGGPWDGEVWRVPREVVVPPTKILKGRSGDVGAYHLKRDGTLGWRYVWDPEFVDPTVYTEGPLE